MVKNILHLAAGVCLFTTSVRGFTSDSTLIYNQENRIAVGDASSSWYFTPHIGLNLISDTSTEGMNIEFSNGLSLGGGFGCELQSDLAFQFEFGYIRNDVAHFIDEATNTSSSPDVEFTQIPLIANLIWSPSHQPDIKPYFVLGAGAIRGKYDSNAFIDSGAEWALGVRAGVGATVDLSASSSVSIGYQFTLAQYNDAIDNHNIGLQLSLSF